MTVQELNDLVKTAIDTKTDPYTGDPYVPLTPEQRTEMNQIATDVNAKIRGIPSSTVTPADNAEFIQAVKDDPESFLPPQIPSDDDDDKPSSTSGFLEVWGQTQQNSLEEAQLRKREAVEAVTKAA